jgi:hypothetical protein
MDFGELLTDSVEFMRGALAEDLVRGLSLVALYALATSTFAALPAVIPLAEPFRFFALVAFVVISLVSLLILVGYIYRVFRRPGDPPSFVDPLGLLLAGVRLLVVALAYVVPVLLVLLVFGGIGVMGIIASGQSQDMAALFSSIATLGLGILLGLIVWVVVGLIAAIAIVRSARNDSVREAFAFGAIIEHIGRIGWVNYIVSQLVLWIVLGVAYVAMGILAGLPVVGWVAGIVIGPAALLFAARYISIVYNSKPAP